MRSPNNSFIAKIAIIFLCVTLVIPTLSLTAWERPEVDSYIVRSSEVGEALAVVSKAGGEITSDLPLINAVAANLTKEQLASVKKSGRDLSVVENSAVAVSSSDDYSPALDAGKTVTDYPEVVGADQVWAEGVTGAGVTVAVLDTGVEKFSSLKHSAENGVKRILAWKDLVDGTDKPFDPNGHGTHVAGIILNSDLGGDDNWNGVAPNANLVAVRVLDENGIGTYETAIAGLQWVVDHKDEYGIRVVNLSLVSESQAPYWSDPLSQAVTAAWAHGLVVVVAGGNNGPQPLSISSPGNNPYAITVGAFTDAYTPDDWSDDYIADFSSAGPTLDGFTKPDLVAPGGHIASLTPQNSVLNNEYPEAKLPANYFTMAGTSQATGVVSGVAALVLSSEPQLTNDQVKMRLISTALVWMDETGDDAAYSVWQQGAGRLNAYDAVFSGDVGSANQGMDIWADLNDVEHYEGYGYFDEDTATFELAELETNEIGNYTSWDGTYFANYGDFGLLSSEFLAELYDNTYWTDHYDVLAAKSKIWAGKSKIWAGKSKIWAGGYTTWVDDPSVFFTKSKIWAGKSKIWAGSEFFDAYKDGTGMIDGSATYSITNFLVDQ